MMMLKIILFNDDEFEFSNEYYKWKLGDKMLSVLSKDEKKTIYFPYSGMLFFETYDKEKEVDLND